jgi:hypothetical protein
LIDSIDLYEDAMKKEKDREDWTGTSDDETVLPMHDDDELSNDGDADADLNERVGRHWKSIKGTLWVILATTATLAGRRVLRAGFREYFSFFELDTRADLTKLIVSFFQHHNNWNWGINDRI